MSTSVQAIGTLAPQPREEVKRLFTGLEAAALFACALLYIWRWQHTHPRLWIAFLPVLAVSHLLHRDTLGGLGLGRINMGANARLALPIMLALYIPMVIFGLASGRLQLLWPGPASALYFLSSAVVALMFGAAHIPNPVLMVATTIAGFIFSEIFARYRNIWPLALAQTVGGFLVAALTPAWLIHNMRVGPGYFFWGIH